MREQLKNLALMMQGDVFAMIRALHQGVKIDSLVSPHPFISIFDQEYPKSLLRLQTPPLVLFYKGKPDLLTQPAISLVGSRKASIQTLNRAKPVIKALGKTKVLVSGLAKGMDALVHHIAIASNYSTIGVLGCGLNRIYPRVNRPLFEQMAKDHLILSEYPGDVDPLPQHFRIRNRIIAGLSKNLVVLSAGQKSGTLITANYGLEVNSDIYCLGQPSLDPREQGLLDLVNQGAWILTKNLLSDLIERVE